MSITYDEDGANILIEGEQCPTCSGKHTLYDATFGFWKCEDCSTVWGKDIDDPDYEETDYERCPYCEQMTAYYSKFFGMMRCNVCASHWMVM